MEIEEEDEDEDDDSYVYVCGLILTISRREYRERRKEED
jgi:hypothetical protein